MANHYIRQDLERRMILLGLSDVEIAVFINVAVHKELNIQEENASMPAGSMTERPGLSLVSPQGEEST